ncbi:MFS transporter [Polycladidibacter stylochi]|uniref:MFS transporter n=1 Tax=Polycladidibacter stylochi TaxID=1807766 RepID=UPI00082D8E2B|nr:MFS transporter [Pseudovibrio stylochi]
MRRVIPLAPPLANHWAWYDKRALSLLFAAALTVLANTAISPALPDLQAMYASQPGAQWLTRLLVPAPSLSVIFAAPLCGSFADKYGRRPLLLSGVLLFAIAGTIGMVLPGLVSIMISRLILGIAVAMVMTAQTALTGDYYTQPKRSQIIGLQISARNFGGLVFILIASFLASLSPKAPFAVYALALLILPFLLQSIKEPQITVKQQQQTTNDTQQAASSWRLQLVILALLQLLTNLCFFILPTQLPFYFDSLGKSAAILTGFALATIMIMGGTSALYFSKLSKRIGNRRLLSLAYLFMASGIALLSTQNTLAIFVGVAATGTGYALASPIFPAIALQIAPAQQRGRASGMITTSIFMGQLLSVFASMPLINTIGYQATFAIIASFLCCLSLIAALLHFDQNEQA